MKLIIRLVAFFATCSLWSLSDYGDVYPPVFQTLAGSDVFRGDRHGEFKGDAVAVLSDGSAWKVHPDSKKEFTSWQPGDTVRMAVRTDWYWFSRQHHFLLVNHTKGAFAKVMLVQNKSVPLTIVKISKYYKLESPVYHYTTYKDVDSEGNEIEKKAETFVGYEPSDPRQILVLSDGSIWVIKNNFRNFQLGTKVYIGAQGDPRRFYDFVLVSGNQREATWTLARPQK